MSVRVLLVEDSPTQAAALHALLESSGYETLIASSGEEAIDLFDGSEVDVVVSDIVMPGRVDGYELCRRIKNGTRRQVPVVLLTSLSDALDIIRGLEAGADNFFTKPYVGEDLLERLHKLLLTRESRATQKMHVGVDVIFLGRRFTITSEREQILDLLISTFEDAVRQNQELRRREEELEAARAEIARYARTLEGRLDSVLGSIPDVLFSVSPDLKRVFYVSPAVQRVFGRDPSDTSFESWRAGVHADDIRDVLASMDRAARSGKPQTIEYRFAITGGRPRWISQVVVPVRDESGRLTRLDGTARDITEARELQQQFHQAQKMESVGRLAGGVAHDFNNLLTIIFGEVDFAAAALPTEDELRPSLDEIRKAAERAALLTRRLLAFSRQRIVEPVVFNINDVVTDLESMLHRLIGADVEITTHPGRNLDRVKMDRGELEQVLVNLVVNARDAMPSGGRITIETSNVSIDGDYASVHADVRPGEYVLLCVTDTGSGIPEEIRDKIFDPFFTTKEDGRGTGLGLSTCHGIVKQAGGHIGLYSEMGIGTTMKIYLPAIAEAETVAVAPAAAPTTGTERILLVEDDESLRTLTGRMLTAQGYEVLKAASGSEALRVLEQNGTSVDLLVTDIVLPEMGGRAVADRVKQVHPDIKVLYISGYPGDVALTHREPVDGAIFLQKPFTQKSLGAKVREVLDAQ